jgi:LytTr DNA-binding domain
MQRVFSTISNLLNRPYMAYTTGWHNLSLIIGSSIFIFTFLFIFEPFTIYTITDAAYKLQLILGFTVVPPCCVIFMIEIMGRIFPKVYQEKGWTVRSEILFVMSLILLITIGNYMVSILMHSDKITMNISSFFKMLFYTATISFFPAVAFVWFRYYQLTQKYSRPAQVFLRPDIETTTPSDDNEQIQPEIPILPSLNGAPKNLVTTLTLVAENGKDKIQVLPQQLCYIEADDNYVTVAYLRGGQLRKELLRSSLARVEAQIKEQIEGQVPCLHIRRCHRSYMVNLEKVQRVSGNAQGYKLHLLQVDEALPVSRNYAKEVVLSA